jgi:DNA polymerase
MVGSIFSMILELIGSESVTWDTRELHFGPGVPSSDAPAPDELESLWKTYYGSIFNPARIKLDMMTREMPRRHWATLPETEIIPDLLVDAPRRVDEMIARQEGFATSAADFFPAEHTIAALGAAAENCKGCDLHHNATQTVFGEGPQTARLVLVGEQPGEVEDSEGRPFIGPAGKLLDDAMEAAGLDRTQVYVTNAVKHFKYQRRGKKRIHQRPDAREIAACKPWVEAELALIESDVIVCLGATAARSLLTPGFSVTKQRGRIFHSDYCETTLATFHPSAILRSPSPERRKELRDYLIADLKTAVNLLNTASDQQ